MKKVLLVLLIVVMLILGFGIMFYPYISTMHNHGVHAGLLQEFNEAVNHMDVDEIESQFQRAFEYNEALYHGHVRDPFAEGAGLMSYEYYMETLNINGVMAQLEIPAINVKLPVFHVINDDVLDRGVGHIPGTSFPVGGANTHSILTGHSGMPNARMFTDLKNIVIGDKFFITVLDRKLAYQVDQITVVLPHEIGYLEFEKNADLVTLLTCTPYAVNTHRLLVRGTRIPYEPGMSDEITSMIGTASRWLARIIMLALIFIIALIVYIVRKRAQRSRTY